LTGKLFGEDIGVVKPRTKGAGQTMVLDRLSYPASEVIDVVHGYTDVLKIGWGLPFLLEEDELRRRVQAYRQKSMHVSNGGTLLEICISKGKEDFALERLSHLGFDTIELSEGIIEVPTFVKKKIVEFAHSKGMRLHVEVGRKNPKNQLSLEDTITRIEQSFDSDPDIVIVEGRESGRSVGIFDDDGRIKWDWVGRLEEISNPSKLMFEAPQEEQQTELIIHIGSNVNLGNVSVASVVALETQRQGLRGDTFGAIVGSRKVEGGPAAKFLYFVISAHGPLDQSRLVQLTGLNRRTVQASLRHLLHQGVVGESVDPKDLRRRLYSSSYELS
jgi:phosphosulfolactate synthase